MTKNQFIRIYLALCIFAVVASMAFAGGPVVNPSVDTSTLALLNGNILNDFYAKRFLAGDGSVGTASIGFANYPKNGMAAGNSDYFVLQAKGVDVAYVYYTNFNVYKPLFLSEYLSKKYQNRNLWVQDVQWDRQEWNTSTKNYCSTWWYDNLISSSTLGIRHFFTTGSTPQLWQNPTAWSFTRLQVDYSTSTRNIEFSAQSSGTARINGISFDVDGTKTLDMSATGTIIASQTFFTPIGGSCIRMTAGEAMTNGAVVVPSTSGATNTVSLSSTSSQLPIGVVYGNALTGSTTCAVSDQVWVVVSGKAYVNVEGPSVPGDLLLTSTAEVGKAVVDNAPNTTTHWREIGHCISGGASGTQAIAVLHFN